LQGAGGDWRGLRWCLLRGGRRGVVEPNPELLSAAEELDAKLAALATKVTSGS